jgi:D-alanyl-D-alanine carboxypeptidase/D-alanyl-D-alanine-endopeptidase (penicillin-binding protein 4)
VSVVRSTDERGDRIAVSGSIAAGDELTVHRAMSDPAAGTGQILRSILLQAGVTVDGAVETTVTAGATPRLLARVEGLLLQEQIGRMMRWSNNYIADALTMGIALARTGAPPASLAAAAGGLAAMVGSGAILESGSGLTTSNRLSAQDLVDVLGREYHDARRFPAFYGSLVTPRDAPFDFLRRGSDDWLDRVALKSGSLSEPVSVTGIAGYLRKKDGGFMAFAVIVNGSARLPQVSLTEALAAMREDLQKLLTRY